jgi:methionine-rich copper-binding protein CopC
MIARLFLRAALACALALAGAQDVRAHAFLDHAAPSVGSTLRAAPRQIRLWFTEEIEPAFSTIEVLNAAGQRVDEGSSRVDPNNATILGVALKPLPPGTYKVIWHVVSVDTHPTDGSFSFTVARD